MIRSDTNGFVGFSTWMQEYFATLDKLINGKCLVSESSPAHSNAVVIMGVTVLPKVMCHQQSSDL